MFALASLAQTRSVTLTKEPFRVPSYFDGGLFVKDDIHAISGTADASGGKLTVHNLNGTVPDYTIDLNAGKEGFEKKCVTYANATVSGLNCTKLSPTCTGLFGPAKLCYDIHAASPLGKALSIA